MKVGEIFSTYVLMKSPHTKTVSPKGAQWPEKKKKLPIHTSVKHPAIFAPSL